MAKETKDKDKGKGKRRDKNSSERKDKDGDRRKDKNGDRRKDNENGAAGESGRLLVVAGAGMRVSLAVAAAVAVCVGMFMLREHVLASSPNAEKSVRIVLADPPAWLPDDIAGKVSAEVQSAVNDRKASNNDLAKDVYLAASGNAWISKVRRVTRRRDGGVVIEAEFRKPFALAATVGKPGKFHVVDTEGVVLPLPTGRVKPGALVAIDGVVSEPPKEGEKWDCPDLAAGLRLLGLIKDRPFFSQITTIDVRNHNGRSDSIRSHLVIYAQVGRSRRTEVRFGRLPVVEFDTCRSPAAKLADLDRFVERNGGKLAGVREWVDIRYDKLYASNY